MVCQNPEGYVGLASQAHGPGFQVPHLPSARHECTARVGVITLAAKLGAGAAGSRGLDFFSSAYRMERLAQRARFAERQEGRRKAGQKAGKAWEAYHRLQRQRAAREWAPRDLRVKAQQGEVAAES